MQAANDCDELRKLYDKLNLTGRVLRVGQHAVSGGCANVWEARLMSTKRRSDGEGEKVAVKVIREVGSSASETSLRKRLIREVRTWSTLHHRNVLPLYGFTYGFSPGSRLASLVSPWMSNGTARRYLEKRSVAERIRILTGVADGLCYLHRHDVVHGDLKGDNIMIDLKFEPRIADFGLSKLLDEVTSTLTVTHTGNPFGSVRWTARELFFSPGVNYESDVWSFGMTVLELFTNAPPFRHLNNDAQVIIKVHNGELPTRPGPRSGMDDALWDICCDCWKSDPRLRPSTQVIAKRLWELDLKCKLQARKKRCAPPSPERRQNSQEQKGAPKEEMEGRLRKSPRLSALAELASDSYFDTPIPVEHALVRSSTPRTPTSRSASGSHTRTASMSSSRRSSRSNLANEIDPRRLISSTHSDGDLFSTLHHHPAAAVRRAQTEPIDLDLSFAGQGSSGDFGGDSSLVLSTPRRNLPHSFVSPPHSSSYMNPNAYSTPPNTYATPPNGYATHSEQYATRANVYSTPPGMHAQLYPQYELPQQQQALLIGNYNDMELLSQSEFLGGFDADIVHPSQWTAFYPPDPNAAFMNSFPLQNGSFHDGAYMMEAQNSSSTFLLPPPPTEADYLASGYSPAENSFPSPHALGLFFSENVPYEAPQATPSHYSPLLLNEHLYNSPPSLHEEYRYRAPQQTSAGTVDFSSLQGDVFSPALSDVSEPDTCPTPALDETPFMDGYGDAPAFESQGDGEMLEGLALFGGFDVKERSPAHPHAHPDPNQTPHGSPRQLQYALPLGRGQGLGIGTGPQHAQMPPTPRLSPLLSSF